MLSAGLEGVATAIGVSQRTHQTILENLGWAFGYNAAALPLAALGLLNPVMAGATMGLSSVSVVANSLRLRHFEAGAGKSLAQVAHVQMGAGVWSRRGWPRCCSWPASWPGRGGSHDRERRRIGRCTSTSPRRGCHPRNSWLRAANGWRSSSATTRIGRARSPSGPREGPSSGPGATDTVTVNLVGRGQVPFGCAGGPVASVTVG